LVGDVLHDDSTFRQYVAIIELQRGNSSLGVYCEQVLAVAGILGRKFNLGQIEFVASFEQDKWGDSEQAPGRNRVSLGFLRFRGAEDVAIAI